MLIFMRSLMLIGLFGLALQAFAIDEKIAFQDPEMQERYENINRELRCLVCQNQSLADSDAELAHDLRAETSDVHRTVDDAPFGGGAGMVMKPEPVRPIQTEDEQDFYDSYVHSRPSAARRLKRRIRQGGPIRSADMEGEGSRGWWDLKLEKRVATALWSSGELAIAERSNFQRSFDLAERVIPDDLRARSVPREEALSALDRFDDSLVIVAADHGEAFNEHGFVLHGHHALAPDQPREALDALKAFIITVPVWDQAQGQGAGVAAAISVKTGKGFSSLDVSAVQGELRRQGARLR